MRRGGPDERVPLEVAFSMLNDAIAITGDPNIGLRAAIHRPLDAPLLEYLVATSRTIRDALQTLARSINVLNDALEIRLHEDEDRAILEFRFRVPTDRAAADFAVANYFLSRQHAEPPDEPATVAIWFPYPEPPDTRVYREIFGDCAVVFSARLCGVVFPVSRLDLPMRHSDRRLHELLTESVKRELASSSSRVSLAQQVLAILHADATFSATTATGVAAQLEMSARTLSRRLEEEGTSFRVLLDETRCVRALRYLRAGELTTADISRKLGFAEPASFYKAFRRWVGVSPAEYLQRRR